MGGIEALWIGLERAKAGFGAEVDRPPAVFRVRKILRVGMMEDASTEGDEVQ